MSIPDEVRKYIIKYSSQVRDIVKFLREGIVLLNDVRVGEAMDSLAKAVRKDTEADATRREILYKLSTFIKDAAVRESISRLIRRLDLLSESSKEAARYLGIIPYLEIPMEIREKIEELSKLSLEAVDMLNLAIRALMEGDVETATSHANRVEEIEEEADEVNLIARKLLVASAMNIENSAIVVMLRDFIESLEGITDYAEDAADYVRVLALRQM
ncbi:MAG: hypothetical protein B6U85_04675 [Desulfurococcales archaeon ex4484_42]|nr:MAG: hypothetical protein B6U85_04675 [Desulfurococcales archaeon ex4484_42]